MCEQTKLINAALDAYERRHPTLAAIQKAPEKTQVQRFFTHWMTIAATAIALTAGCVNFIISASDTKRNAEHAKAEIPKIHARLLLLEASNKDLDRLTIEAKAHRDDHEIHMSKEEKKLQIIEGNQEMKEEIQKIVRFMDRLEIEQGEVKKKIAHISDQQDLVSKKIDELRK